MNQTLLLLIVSSLALCLVLVRRTMWSPHLAPAGHFLSEQRGGRGKQSPARTASAGGATDAAKSGLSAYPDLPLKKMPRNPVTPGFVVEHRTALKGKEINVSGRVVAAPRTPTQGTGTPSPLGDARPRIFLADTSEESRDRNYDLMILLGEDDGGSYAVGDKVEVKGTVESSKVAVYLRKIY